MTNPLGSPLNAQSASKDHLLCPVRVKHLLCKLRKCSANKPLDVHCLALWSFTLHIYDPSIQQQGSPCTDFWSSLVCIALFLSEPGCATSSCLSLSNNQLLPFQLSEASVFSLGSLLLFLQLQAGSHSNGGPYLLYFLSLRDHNPTLPYCIISKTR